MDRKDELNSLLLEMVSNQKKAYKSLIKIFITTIILYTTLLVFMVCGFFIYESQFETEEKLTVTQEASGDNAEISNVNGNLYKDNAIHNEGK